MNVFFHSLIFILVYSYGIGHPDSSNIDLLIKMMNLLGFAVLFDSLIGIKINQGLRYNICIPGPNRVMRNFYWLLYLKNLIQSNT